MNTPRFRVGRQIGRNLYDGDRDIGRCDTVLDARELVTLANVAEDLRALDLYLPSVEALRADKRISLEAKQKLAELLERLEQV